MEVKPSAEQISHWVAANSNTAAGNCSMRVPPEIVTLPPEIAASTIGTCSMESAVHPNAVFTIGTW
eukprot:3940350-Rhodomonas_salina.1